MPAPRCEGFAIFRLRWSDAGLLAAQETLDLLRRVADEDAAQVLAHLANGHAVTVLPVKVLAHERIDDAKHNEAVDAPAEEAQELGLGSRRFMWQLLRLDAFGRRSPPRPPRELRTTVNRR